jgi:hypothetical protein
MCNDGHGVCSFLEKPNPPSAGLDKTLISTRDQTLNGWPPGCSHRIVASLNWRTRVTISAVLVALRTGLGMLLGRAALLA